MAISESRGWSQDPEFKKRAQEKARRLYAQKCIANGELEKAREYCEKNNLGWPPFPAKGLPPMAVPPPSITDPVELERTKLLQQKGAIEKIMARPNRFNAGRKPKRGNAANKGKTRGKKVPLKLDAINARLAELDKQAPDDGMLDPKDYPLTDEAAKAFKVWPAPAQPEPVLGTSTVNSGPTYTFTVDASKTPGTATSGGVAVEIRPSAIEDCNAFAAALEGDSFTEPTKDTIEEARIMFKCINPRLLGIRFLDGREASLWREPGLHVGNTVKVRFVDGVFGTENAIYEEVRE